MQESPVRKPTRYVYSEKISDRRKSLFPCEKLEKVEQRPDNSHVDSVSRLNSSDTECGNDADDNICFIASTKLISDMLSTPKRNNYPPSEQSMSPLYLSPYSNAQGEKRSILSMASPTTYLKTPNDSNVHCGVIPKLSRKLLQACAPKQHNSTFENSRCSKVRTSLFPEFDVSLAPKQFYPKVDSPKPCDKIISLKQITIKMNRTRKSLPKNRKRTGQINAGVRHNIKKPKVRKSLENHKISNVSKRKTINQFKKSPAIDVNPELRGFFNVLEEFNYNKEIRLIQPTSARNKSNSSEDRSSTNLKRHHSNLENESCKKQKLYSNTLSDNIENLQSVENLGQDSEVECTQNIDDILKLIDESIEENKENESAETSKSNIVTNHFTETLLSPTSEMCNMASVMKIESPKKVKNLNLIFHNMMDNDNKEDNQVPKITDQSNDKSDLVPYFPIFDSNHKATANSEKKTLKVEYSNQRKRPTLSSNQMLLDAGQKRFGPTECCECNYVYHAGDPNDEIMHQNHHSATHTLQFAGWKNERVVKLFPNGDRIIQVFPGDSKLKMDKISRVTEVINRSMGYYDMTLDLSASKVFLYISNKTITGCLIAENKTRGFKVLTSNIDIDLCSTEEYPIECGVSRIWVSSHFRNKGIATKLMDGLKSHFKTDRLLNNCDIALSSPTYDGKLFAAKYFKTPNFFTYFD